MKKLLLLACVLAASCSRPGDPASAPAAAPSGPAYDLELSYGTRGALYLTVEEPGRKKERYLLRLAMDYRAIGGMPDDAQVFWGDQWPAEGDTSGLIKVRRDPFLVLYRDGKFSVARVPHMVKEGETEHHLQGIRGLYKGGIDVEYAQKDARPDAKPTFKAAPALVPARKFSFSLPTNDIR